MILRIKENDWMSDKLKEQRFREIMEVVTEDGL